MTGIPDMRDLAVKDRFPFFFFFYLKPKYTLNLMSIFDL